MKNEILRHTIKRFLVFTILLLTLAVGTFAQHDSLHGTTAFCNPTSTQRISQPPGAMLNRSVAQSATIPNTDFVSAGVGGMRTIGTGQISLSGISGTVTRAYLYWHGVTNSTTNVGNVIMVNSQSVTGTNIGVSDNNCWEFNNSQAYRADVTALVQSTRNGTYSLSSFGALNPNGASIIVFFDDGNNDNNRDVVIFEGNDSNIFFAGITGNPNAPADPAGWNVLLSGINYSSGNANIQLHVADGQLALDDALRINNVQIVPQGPVFQGNTVPGPVIGASGGNLWDIRSFNVTSFLTPGSNSLNLTTGTNLDCLGLIVALIDLPAGAAPSTVFYSKAAGDLHNVLTWGDKPDGSGINPTDFGAGKTFMLANRVTNYTLTANWTVGGILNIPASGQLQINTYTLSVADVTGAGSFSGTPSSNLVVNQPLTSSATSLNFTTGANNLNNLSITSAGTTSAVSSLNIYGVLTAQNGAFNTGNALTLKSTATNTARVAPVTGSISGMVTVERYIPARRAWRMISAPVGGTQTINSAWQEGATTSSANPDPNPGYGTHITEGNAADGLDHNPYIAMSSLKKYVSATDMWTPITNTYTTNVSTEAYFLFVRGNRAIPLGFNTVTPNNTVLRATGPLKSGNQVFNISGTGFTAVPNPFASPIDFASVVKSGVQNNFYVWDPKMGGENGVGAYVLLSFNGTSYDVIPASVSPESQYIQSGQAFLVRASTAGVSGTLTIREQDKSATPVRDVFRVADGSNTNQTGSVQFTPANSGQSLRVNLQLVNADNTSSLLDEVFASYKDNYSDKLDNLDAIKAANMEENLAIIREGKDLMVDRKTLPVNPGQAMQLKLWNTQERKYVLEFNPTNLGSSGLSAVLEDKFLHTVTPISLSENSRVFFNVTADASSKAPDRFNVVFNPKDISSAASLAKNSITSFPNPMRGRTINIQLNDRPEGTYVVSLTDNMGRLVYSTRIKHAGGSATKTIQLTNKLSRGTYHLVITDKANVQTTLHLLNNE